MLWFLDGQKRFRNPKSENTTSKFKRVATLSVRVNRKRKKKYTLFSYLHNK